jgi:hypothetical protein
LYRLTDGTYTCKHPCPHCTVVTDLFDSPVIDWYYHTHHTSISNSINYIYPWINWESHNSFQYHNGKLGGESITINFRHSQYERKSIEYFLCTNFHSISEPYLIIYASQSFNHLLDANPFHGSEIKRLFGVHSFAYLSSFFMKEPAERLKPAISKYIIN